MRKAKGNHRSCFSLLKWGKNMEALIVYTVNNRGPHGRLACVPAKCVPPKIKTSCIIIVISVR